MATEASRSTTTSGGVDGGASGNAADSYIGSVISLTSKHEIRYEGILFNVDTTQASIGLRNVRSFGTEGRKKDGPQVPAADTVYDYIVFRGTDIKDLQVKSSPPVQTAPSVHNDPAIIQSHYTPPTAPSSTPSALATVTHSGGSSSDYGTRNPQSGVPRTTYQNSTPFPDGSLSSWTSSPPPMYWQQPQPQLQPQPFLHSAQRLPMQPSLMPPLAQQQILHSNLNPSYSAGASNMSASQYMGFPPPPPMPQPIIGTTVSWSPIVPPSPSSALAVAPSDTLPSMTPPQAVPIVSNSVLDKNTVPTLIPNQPKLTFGSSIPFNSTSEPLSSVGGTSNSPTLVTPGQFLHPGVTVSQTSQMTQKDVEVVHAPSVASSPQPQDGNSVPVTALPIPVSAGPRAPALPLPAPVNQKYVNRGGRGGERRDEFYRYVPNYTEEFDFEAMNERFRKDEVWGHLGKTTTKTNDGRDVQDANGDDVVAADKKPTYKKDDFFDTLSTNALDRESRNRRPRFSEQMKFDTETFGDFPRNQGFRGGRGPGRGGWQRGGYHGRGYGNGNGNGYGYGGRGRGRGREENVYRAI